MGDDEREVYTGITFSDYYSAPGYNISPFDIGITPESDDWDEIMKPIEEDSYEKRRKMDIGDKLEYDGFYVIKKSKGVFVLCPEKSLLNKLIVKFRRKTYLFFNKILLWWF